MARLTRVQRRRLDALIDAYVTAARYDETYGHLDTFAGRRARRKLQAAKAAVARFLDAHTTGATGATGAAGGGSNDAGGHEWVAVYTEVASALECGHTNSVPRPRATMGVKPANTRSTVGDKQHTKSVMKITQGPSRHNGRGDRTASVVS